MHTIIFLTIEEVLLMHECQIRLFGGHTGIREKGLLESALALPLSTFGGSYLCQDIYEMAASYMFHIIKNHPFIDGNKRMGVIVSLTFLKRNNIPLIWSNEEIFTVAKGVAESVISKNDLIDFFKKG